MARYWPEFGQAGKAAITLRQALAHRAGLSYLDRDLTTAEVIAWDPVIDAIEHQVPHHAPTDGHAYHAVTIGWLVGEVIKRITGLTPGAFFRQRLGDPLELDTWIGLPDSARPQVAFMEAPLPDDDSDFAKGFASALFDPSVERTGTMGGAWAFPADSSGYVTFNSPAIQAAEIPGAGGISSAESLAKLYAACVTGVDGQGALLTRASIADGLRVQSTGTAADRPARRWRELGDRLPDLVGTGAAPAWPRQLRPHGGRRTARLRRRGLRGELRLCEQPDGRVRRCPRAPARGGPAVSDRWLTRRHRLHAERSRRDRSC